MMSTEEIIKLILEKVNKLDDHLDSVDKTLIKQEANLAEHMRRTDLLETQVKSIQDEIVEIQKPITVAIGIGKIIGWISVAVGIVATVISIVKP